MRKKLLLAFLLLLFNICGCAKQSTNHNHTGYYVSNIVHSKVVFDNRHNYWRHVDAIIKGDIDEDVFVPQDETKVNWTRKIKVINRKNNSNITALAYYKRVLKTDLADKCYFRVPKTTILKQNSNNIIYEYYTKNCGKMSNQTVIGRIIVTPKSIANISYAIKTDELLSQQREDMLNIMDSARVIEDAY